MIKSLLLVEHTRDRLVYINGHFSGYLHGMVLARNENDRHASNAFLASRTHHLLITTSDVQQHEFCA